MHINAEDLDLMLTIKGHCGSKVTCNSATYIINAVVLENFSPYCDTVTETEGLEL